jgi:pyridoxine 4-dehydrogenase
MQPTTIGGIAVSPVGLGTGRLASLGARHSLRDAARLLDAASDLGVTFIDTADTYGSTTCERWLGAAMKRQPERFAVATKCGLPTAHLRGPLRYFNQPAKKLLQRVGPEHHLDPQYVRRSIDGSLRRLRRERIEFYFLHTPYSGIEREDGLFEVLEEAKKQGKIANYGVSSDDLEIVESAARVRNCRVAQTAINPSSFKELTALLDAAPDAASLEFIANHVLGGNQPPEGGGSSAARSSLPAGRSGLNRVQRLIRNAAALPHVKVVLIGTSNVAHLAEAVAALATPARQEDLLT